MHKLNGEYPRLFKKIRACSFFSKQFVSSLKIIDEIQLFLLSLFFVKSMSSTEGKGNPENCLERNTCSYLFLLMLF